MQSILRKRTVPKTCMFAGLLFLCSETIHSEGERELRGRLGGSTEIFQTRFVSREDSHFYGFWVEGEYGPWKGILESRGGRSLGSLEFQNDYWSISAGHRYKSIPGFFFGRDPRIYSTLTDHQPIEKSAFISLLPGYFSPGLFWMESITGKNSPGFAFAFPEQTLAFTYSPATDIRSIYTKLDELRIVQSGGLLPGLYLTIRGEAVGTPTNFLGRYFFRLQERDWEGFKWEARFYRDRNGEIFESPDSFLEQFTETRQEISGPTVSWTAIQTSPWFRVEGLDSLETGERFRYAGVRIGILPLPLGRLGYRHRTYEETLDLPEERFRRRVPAHSILWLGAGRKYSFVLGREFRANGDRTTEVGLDWNGNGWNLSSAVLFQKEGNELLSPVERYTGLDRPDITLTDRKTVLRFRFRTRFLDWNVTSSERMGQRGSLVFMNLQFLYEF